MLHYTHMSLDAILEGVLFYKAAPMKIKELAALTESSEEAVHAALTTLSERLSGGMCLIVTESEALLTTAPELTGTIAQLRKAELSRDIGKAGAETLAIVLYRGPIARSEIDRIRGVNSSYILRNLAIRGLIERSGESKRVTYSITPQLLQHLGISNKQSLPGFTDIMAALTAYEAAQDAAEDA